MNRTELLDGLYATRRELLRLIIGTAHLTTDPVALQRLVERRDQITWTINALIDAEQLAAMADIDAACTQIDGATRELQHLTAVAKDIDTAITISKKVLDVAGGVLAASA